MTRPSLIRRAGCWSQMAGVLALYFAIGALISVGTGDAIVTLQSVLIAGLLGVTALAVGRARIRRSRGGAGVTSNGLTGH